MKYQKNRIWLLAVAAVLMGMTALAFYITRSDGRLTPADQVQLVLTRDGSAETVRFWQAQDGTLHGFLPAYAGSENVSLRCRTELPVSLDGQRIADGAHPQNIQWDREQELSIGEKSIPVQFHRGSDLPALYIRIGRGGIAPVNKAKENKSAVQLSLYDSRGRLDYRTEDYKDKISGHGNSTWTAEEKPYKLTLSKPTSLLGGGKGQKWILLANFYDPSNLRDFMWYDLARSMSDIWSPDCFFVDVYIDGDYAGLYLMTEQVEVGDDRVTLSPEEVLLNLETEGREKDYNLGPFAKGVMAEIVYPKNLSGERYDRLQASLAEVRDTVLSGTASEDYLKQHLDLDSWVWKYLLEEISSNFDAGACSQYFSFDGSKLVSRAAWDYDNILGNMPHLRADSFQALRQWQYPFTATPWYAALYRYDLFRNMVESRYRDDFLPYIRGELARKTEAEHQKIRASVSMDSLRWPGKYRRYSPEDAYRQMEDYLAQRLQFLSSAWIDGKEYCMVSFVGDPSVYFTVETGSTLAQLMENSDAGQVDISDWYDVENGDPVDLSAPITRDLILFRNSEKKTGSAGVWGLVRKLIANRNSLLSGFTLAILMLFGILIFRRDRKKYSAPGNGTDK